MKQKLSDGGPIDVEYWEVLLKALVVWKAKAKIKEMHAELLAKRIEQLREKQKLEMENKANDANKSDHEENKDSTHEDVTDHEDNTNNDDNNEIPLSNESIKLSTEGDEEEDGDYESLDAIEENQKVNIYIYLYKYIKVTNKYISFYLIYLNN